MAQRARPAKSGRKPAKKSGKRGPDKRPRKLRTDGQRPPKSAGRPKGIAENVPRGTTTAVRAMHWRVPQDAPEAARDIADKALAALVLVVDGKVPASKGAAIVKAAVQIREEVCGSVRRHVTVDFPRDRVPRLELVIVDPAKAE